MDIRAWKARVEAQRQEKDRFFARDPQSPVPPYTRGAFQGLAYFPPDPAYRFVLQLNEHETKEVIDVIDTTNQTRRFWRWGQFQFEIEGVSCALQVYKSDPDEDRLFVPFRDKTSGDETYGAGRYLDFEPDPHRIADGRWVVDLNEAYNPWCAYSDAYACPLVPPENWLQIPIRAGEKAYEPMHPQTGR